MAAVDFADITGDSFDDLLLALYPMSSGTVVEGLAWTNGVFSSTADILAASGTLTRIDGVRHVPADGGTLVADFGAAGLNTRVARADGGYFGAASSAQVDSMSRVSSAARPELAFIAQVAGCVALLSVNGTALSRLDVGVLPDSSTLGAWLPLDAGAAHSVTAGDFRATSGDGTPAIVVAGPDSVLAYAFLDAADAGLRWSSTPTVLRQGPAAAVGIAVSQGRTLTTDLFLVLNTTPRTLIQIPGQ